MERAALLTIALALGGCGVHYDPKGATFHHGANQPFHAPVKQPASVESKFEWVTTETDAETFLDKVARRAAAFGVVSSRLGGTLELSSKTIRLRMSPAGRDLQFECWAASREHCNELLESVLEADEPK